MIPYHGRFWQRNIYYKCLILWNYHDYTNVEIICQKYVHIFLCIPMLWVICFKTYRLYFEYFHPSRCDIPHLVCPGVRVFPLNFEFFIGFSRLISVRYLYFSSNCIETSLFMIVCELSIFPGLQKHQKITNSMLQQFLEQINGKAPPAFYGELKEQHANESINWRTIVKS